MIRGFFFVFFFVFFLAARDVRGPYDVGCREATYEPGPGWCLALLSQTAVLLVQTKATRDALNRPSCVGQATDAHDCTEIC